MKVIELIKKELPGVLFNEPLARHTTFYVGGPAEYFYVAKKTKDLKKSSRFAIKNKIKFFILAGGSNVLFMDKGFDGLVVLNDTGRMDVNESLITVDSGYNLHGLVVYAAKHGFGGLEWASGIPGTAGGAVRGNAGAYGGCMADVISGVEVFDVETGKVKNFSKDECEFEYRASFFKKNKNLVILKVKLKFSDTDSERLIAKSQELIRARQEKEPKLPSAGCVFKNIPMEKIKGNEKVEAFLNEVKFDKVPAGLLIDKAHLKGKKIGGAKISEKHANFIVNAGNASADDVLKLISLMKMKIRNKFGVDLELEIEVVGS